MRAIRGGVRDAGAKPGAKPGTKPGTAVRIRLKLFAKDRSPRYGLVYLMKK